MLQEQSSIVLHGLDPTVLWASESGDACDHQGCTPKVGVGSVQSPGHPRIKLGI